MSVNVRKLEGAIPVAYLCHSIDSCNAISVGLSFLIIAVIANS